MRFLDRAENSCRNSTRSLCVAKKLPFWHFVKNWGNWTYFPWRWALNGLDCWFRAIRRYASGRFHSLLWRKWIGCSTCLVSSGWWHCSYRKRLNEFHPWSIGRAWNVKACGHHGQLICVLVTFCYEGIWSPKCIVANHAPFQGCLGETSELVCKNVLKLDDTIYQKPYFIHSCCLYYHQNLPFLATNYLSFYSIISNFK